MDCSNVPEENILKYQSISVKFAVKFVTLHGQCVCDNGSHAGHLRSWGLSAPRLGLHLGVWDSGFAATSNSLCYCAAF